jgi:hypothetical protein
MDADRFDALSKSVIARLGRRPMLTALLSGTLASLLCSLETEARPKQHPRNSVTRGSVAFHKRWRMLGDSVL